MAVVGLRCVGLRWFVGLLVCWFALRCMLLRFVLDEARRKKLSHGAYATGAEEATSDIDRER